MRKKIIFCAFLLFGQSFLLFSQQKITFKTGKIPSVKGDSIRLFLAGDFNNWNPADKAYELVEMDAGKYRLSTSLPKGFYHFKVTRGSWQTVECNSFGRNIDNRSLNVLHDTSLTMNVEEWQDNFATQQKQHTASPQVHIISENFAIPQLGRQGRIWIYLPADYNLTTNKYPVIYMQDGQNLFDEFTAGYGEWGIDELLDKMAVNRQCIIIGIDHAGENRITEYNPYDSKYGTGKGDDYVNFLAQILKPYIDLHYRTKNDPSNTTVAGSSMGGLIAMYAALKYPEVFGNAGIFSPAFWIAPGMYPYAQQRGLNPASRFYFVCGGAESESMVADMQRMVAVIRSKGIAEKNSPVVIIPGAQHNEKQWNSDFPAFYLWLFGEVK